MDPLAGSEGKEDLEDQENNPLSLLAHVALPVVIVHADADADADGDAGASAGCVAVGDKCSRRLRRFFVTEPPASDSPCDSPCGLDKEVSTLLARLTLVRGTLESSGSCTR